MKKNGRIARIWQQEILFSAIRKLCSFLSFRITIKTQAVRHDMILIKKQGVTSQGDATSPDQNEHASISWFLRTWAPLKLRKPFFLSLEMDNILYSLSPNTIKPSAQELDRPLLYPAFLKISTASGGFPSKLMRKARRKITFLSSSSTT
ncbi:hypothetical protein M9H77_32949 [Catharanthus roseus]|uniref:Uncharacterized protein n=1 Tax=Catharanthus roseus TaxID=4058 RepID=A0ACC0A5L4_CATRO|nr:hypothetical protein M9H77_32949 [Catharanthus roseus]